MLNKEQLIEMLELQNKMNSVINNNWQNQNWPFLRAAGMEAVEAIGHHGWKWWKKEHKDLEQLQMELIDIWHFYLSDYLTRENNSNKCTNLIYADLNDNKKEIFFDNQSYDLNKIDLITKLELLACFSFIRKTNLILFNNIINDIDLNWHLIYKKYVGKNILNIFRQNNGYNQGTYIKTWWDKEDNEFLTKLLEILPEYNLSKNLMTNLNSLYICVKMKQPCPFKF